MVDEDACEEVPGAGTEAGDEVGCRAPCGSDPALCGRVLGVGEAGPGA